MSWHFGEESVDKYGELSVVIYTHTNEKDDSIYYEITQIYTAKCIPDIVMKDFLHRYDLVFAKEFAQFPPEKSILVSFGLKQGDLEYKDFKVLDINKDDDSLFLH